MKMNQTKEAMSSRVECRLLGEVLKEDVNNIYEILDRVSIEPPDRFHIHERVFSAAPVSQRYQKTVFDGFQSTIQFSVVSI